MMDNESKDVKKKKSKVGVMNYSYEMEEPSATVKNKVSPFLNNVLKAQSKNNNARSYALKAVVDAKSAVSKWKDYATYKRKKKESNSFLRKDGKDKIASIGGLDLYSHNYFGNDEDELSGDEKANKAISNAMNHELLRHFAELGKSENDEYLVLDFVETLIKNGASVNCYDAHGQTLLHEVARRWHTDVAKFLIELGADVNRLDKFGRSPLHVAAADNYPEMVMLLINNGADKNSQTFGECQTPVHYAARNDAVDALQALIKRNCKFKDTKDYKDRTPLHIAAELDRSETARVLLEHGAPAGLYDKRGQSILAWLITKMPTVALDAIKQFHIRDRPNREQFFFLNLLVHNPEKDHKLSMQMPLQVAVQYKQYDILTQQVFLKLLDVMWKDFARLRAFGALLFNFIYIVLWTAYGVSVEYNVRYDYKLPEQWWRIVLLIVAVGCTVYQIVDEIREYTKSKYSHEIWSALRETDIIEDMSYCHPQWPEEKIFLQQELESVNKTHTGYFSDLWNLFDWLCYVLLLAAISTHIADIISHSELLARVHIRFTAVVIIFLWLRLMKNIRVFGFFGPFVAILGEMIYDLLKFAFLYLEFYIPFVCAFWMIFGGTKVRQSTIGDEIPPENFTVDGFQDLNAALFSMFRLTLIDNVPYSDMKAVDSIMTDILLGAWLFLSAILCLNLLIALLADTFQRVYDNARANSVMQRASLTLSIWDGLSMTARLKFIDLIKKHYSPLSEYYDDDMTENNEADLKKVTIKIKEELDEMKQQWNEQFGDQDKDQVNETKNDNEKRKIVTTLKFQDEIDTLREELKSGFLNFHKQQTEMVNKFKQDLISVKSLLLDLKGSDMGQSSVISPRIRHPGRQGDIGLVPSHDARSRSSSRSHRKKKNRNLSKETPNMESNLDHRLPSEVITDGFALQPVVHISTQYLMQEDPVRTNFMLSSRSFMQHGADQSNA